MASRIITRYRLFRSCGFTRGYAVIRACHGPVSWAVRFVVIVACAVIAGCASPVAASPRADDMVIHHGDTVSMPGDTAIGYACVTQPRAYIVNGHVMYERDKYIDMSPCPVIPIP